MMCVDRQMETCLQMDICTYHNARRASAYKWFFNVFFYPCKSTQSVGVLTNKTFNTNKTKSFRSFTGFGYRNPWSKINV